MRIRRPLHLALVGAVLMTLAFASPAAAVRRSVTMPNQTLRPDIGQYTVTFSALWDVYQGRDAGTTWWFVSKPEVTSHIVGGWACVNSGTCKYTWLEAKIDFLRANGTIYSTVLLENLPAVLWSAHGGQEHGNGLADVLLGAADPGGRLTQTWYADAAELPDLLDYDVIGADATYLYHRGEPLYPFGHGLSYAEFDYADLRLSTATARAGEEVEVSVEVTNTGRRPGTEVVQLYTRQRRSRVKQPLRQLRDFARVTLDPGCAARVTMRLRTADLAWWDETRAAMVVEDAVHSVLVGRSARDIRLAGALTVTGGDATAEPAGTSFGTAR